MNEDKIKLFVSSHKETLPDDGFGARLLHTLDVLPQPKPEKDKQPLIVGIFFAIGVMLFVLLGGYGVCLRGMESIGSLFTGAGSVTPEIITTFLILLMAFAGLIRFALKTFER